MKNPKSQFVGNGDHCPACGSKNIRRYKTTAPARKNYRVRYFICYDCPPVRKPFTFKLIVDKTSSLGN